MTELTRLFDLLRECGADFSLKQNQHGEWKAYASWVGRGTTPCFHSVQSSPEAATADVVLHLADWQSKQGDWDTPVPGVPDFEAKMAAAEVKLRELDKEERSRGNVTRDARPV